MIRRVVVVRLVVAAPRVEVDRVVSPVPAAVARLVRGCTCALVPAPFPRLPRRAKLRVGRNLDVDFAGPNGHRAVVALAVRVLVHQAAAREAVVAIFVVGCRKRIA